MEREEVFEYALQPEVMEKLRHRPVIAGKGQASYGVLENSLDALKARLHAPVFDNERMWSALRGSYDVHLHSGPSSTTQRLYDEIDLSIQACEVGQGGLVFKNHDSPSTRSVKLAQKVADQWADEHGKKRVELFGGVVLNYTVGGLNPHAIESAYRLGGKYVWLPNLDANYHRAVVGQGEGQGIDLIDDNDRLVPAMRDVLEVIAETDMVLALGHQSTRERLVVAREAVKMGIQRIEVTHVNFPLAWVTPEQCKLFAELGAYIGIYAMQLGIDYQWEDVMAVYEAVGPQRIVLASDCGHIENPLPWDGMRRLILGFLYRGVKDEDVKAMCQRNAYNLLH